MNATYWANGALDQIGGLPSLPTLTYTPDGEGRPAIVTASAGQNPVLSTQYSTASLPTNMTLGSNDSDSFTFDPNTNRMTQFQLNVNSQSLTGVIGWNALGTPSSLNITDAFNAADTQDCLFAHDDLVRVATVNCGPIWGQSFTYDAFGNITKTVLSGSSGTSFQPTYAIPSTNRIASLPSFTPTYDANGNLTKDPQHQYGWDSDGRPVTIDTIALTYDALDRMVEQNNAGAFTQIVYDPLGEKFALMNAQTLTKAFAPLPDGGIAAYTSTGLAYYRHPDWLGSSRLASTPTQTVYSDTAYAPFGEPYAQSGTADPSFTGQNQDTASNLYDFLYREHSPIQGRWISPDPAGLAAINPTDPQSWNRYAYVRNSPLVSVDVAGLSCITVSVANDDGTTTVYTGDDGDGQGCEAAGVAPDTPMGQGAITPQVVNVLSGDSCDVPGACNGNSGIGQWLSDFFGALQYAPTFSQAIKKVNQCAAGRAASIKSLAGVNSNGFLANSLLGNDASSISNVVFGPNRGAAAGSLAISNPTPINAIALSGQAIGNMVTGTTSATTGVTVVTPTVQVTVSVTETSISTIGGSTVGKLIGGTFAAVGTGKIFLDTGAYLNALYTCTE
jgi:RHS repeat-associated protein